MSVIETLTPWPSPTPHKAVAIDVAALKANPLLPGGFLVTGLVYDVTTGRIEIVVPTSLLRPENPS